MATMNKVIEHVDSVKPNTFDAETKFKWLCDLDGMISRVVMQRDPIKYKFPNDMDTELLVGAPFESIYDLYLEAQVDFHNREYDHYNNSMLMFNAQFEEYKKAYIRENRPVSAGCFKNL